MDSEIRGDAGSGCIEGDSGLDATDLVGGIVFEPALEIVRG
jgi:hypothetical protein